VLTPRPRVGCPALGLPARWRFDLAGTAKPVTRQPRQNQAQQGKLIDGAIGELTPRAPQAKRAASGGFGYSTSKFDGGPAGFAGARRSGFGDERQSRSQPADSEVADGRRPRPPRLPAH
jgi:hypothetical protein